MARTKTATVKTEKAVRKPKVEVVHGFKGFDKDLRCLGYQFEIGKTYEHTGPVRMCASGFHCIDGNPLDVLDYYPLIGGDGGLNRFATVVASGEIKRDKTSKICTAKLTIGAELKLPDLVTAAIKFVSAACKGSKETAASGDSSQLAASGDSSQLAASGSSSKLAASGYCSQLAASGSSSKLAASGYCSQLAASGNSSQLAASGDFSQLAASGSSSQLAASGNSSQLAASGYCSKLEIKGTKSAAAAVGPDSMVKAVAGTPVAICEYNREGKPIGFATGIAGEGDVPADAWLIAKNGKLVEAN